MNTKNNQRYQDMDIYMKAAMLELMQTMPFEKITVKNICQKAGVNRGTFYYHYTDMNDMLESIEEYLGEGLLLLVEEWLYSKNEGSIFFPYLRYIKEHHYAYQTILSNRKILSIKKSFRPLSEQFILSRCQSLGITNNEEINYYNLYFQSGITMVLKHWIETGCETSENEMDKILLNCVPVICNLSTSNLSDNL